MADLQGAFWGWREFFEPPGGGLVAPPEIELIIPPIAIPGVAFARGRQGSFLLSRIATVKLFFSILESTFVAYRYAVYSGYANDVYDSDYTEFPFITEMVFINTWDNLADISFTCKDNAEAFYQILEPGMLLDVQVTGFKVKNSYPLHTARYQLVAFA